MEKWFWKCEKSANYTQRKTYVKSELMEKEMYTRKKNGDRRKMLNEQRNVIGTVKEHVREKSRNWNLQV